MDTVIDRSCHKQKEKDNSFLHASNITKLYGPTVANKNVEIKIRSGEVVGLVGANGAGKSTLMRILSGVTQPDEGSMSISNTEVEWSNYNPIQAINNGIRVVYQELSLCTNLTVYENFYIEQSRKFSSVFHWRDKARKMAKESLERVFPNNVCDINTVLSNLTITQQQMVEIARATSDEKLKLLILDEPTSSLGVEQTEQLMNYIDSERKNGLSFIFITHRLSEIMKIADRVYVMQNGKINWEGSVSETSESDIVYKMGEQKANSVLPASEDTDSGNEKKTITSLIQKKQKNKKEFGIGVKINDLNSDILKNISFNLEGGHIIGIAGLEGSGQRELIRTIFSPNNKESREIDVNGKIAYITGDRKEEGIFPLWSIAKNMVMTAIAQKRMLNKINRDEGKSKINEWFNKLKIVSSGEDARITSLSGGNQQKVLIARAMMADADIIILDDPTRGVDINTKRDLYRLFREIAQKGKLIIWYSSEDDEFTYCDKVLILRNGKMVKLLENTEITKDAIIQVSFSMESKKENYACKEEIVRKNTFDIGGILIPLSTMVCIFVLSGILTPDRKSVV